MQWTSGHETWIRQVHFDDAALTQTFSHYRAVVTGLDAHLAAVESDLKGYLDQGPFAEAVGRLCAYRGVTELGALTLTAEVCDWRRFPTATALNGLLRTRPFRVLERGAHQARPDHQVRQRRTCGPSSSSPPGPTSAPPSGRFDNQEAPGALRSPTPSPGPGPPNSHLCAKFRRLAERKSSRKIVVTAIARELAGFLWAEMAA